MLTLQQVADRRNFLLSRLAEAEEDLKLPDLRPKVRKGVLNLHLALTSAVQELELILGARTSTMLDFSM